VPINPQVVEMLRQALCEKTNKPENDYFGLAIA
jgi:hypothetical protein